METHKHTLSLSLSLDGKELTDAQAKIFSIALQKDIIVLDDSVLKKEKRTRKRKKKKEKRKKKKEKRKKKNKKKKEKIKKKKEKRKKKKEKREKGGKIVLDDSSRIAHSVERGACRVSILD